MSPDIPTSEPFDEDNPISRKGFLKQGVSFLLSHVADGLSELPFEKDTQPQVRPPGALPTEVFLKTCEPFCTACQAVCPRGAILHDAFGLAVIQAEQAPCVMCTDVPCTQVCPTGALTPLAEPRHIALGTAIIELTVCTAYRGSGCKACYDACPIPDEAIRVVEGLPQVVSEYCTGCGVCVYACPTPEALRIRPKDA